MTNTSGVISETDFSWFSIDAWSQSYAGTAGAKLKATLYLEVDISGSTYAPTASGTCEVGLERECYSYGALVMLPGEATAAAHLDSVSTSVDETSFGPLIHDTGIGTPYYIDGSTLSWVSKGGGSWAGTYTFASPSGTSNGNLLSGHGKREGKVTLTSDGVVANTMLVTVHN